MPQFLETQCGAAPIKLMAIEWLREAVKQGRLSVEQANQLSGAFYAAMRTAAINMMLVQRGVAVKSSLHEIVMSRVRAEVGYDETKVDAIIADITRAKASAHGPH